MPLGLVDVIQRGRQGGAEHGRGEDERQQPEREPAGSARPPAPCGGRLVEAVGAGLVGYAARSLHGRPGQGNQALVSHAISLLCSVARLDDLGHFHGFPFGAAGHRGQRSSITPANRTRSTPASCNRTGASASDRQAGRKAGRQTVGACLAPARRRTKGPAPVGAGPPIRFELAEPYSGQSEFRMTSTKLPRLKPGTYRSRTSALTVPNVVSGLGAMPSVNACRIWRLKSGRGCSAVIAARSASLMSW